MYKEDNQKITIAYEKKVHNELRAPCNEVTTYRCKKQFAAVPGLRFGYE